MKVLKKIIISLMVVSMVFAFSCNKNESEKDSSSVQSDTEIINPIKLATPSMLRFENNMFLWNEVANAIKYKISINGEEVESSEARLPVGIRTGSLEVKVMAVGDGERYYNSEYSAPITVIIAKKLDIPKNLRIENDIVLWEKVDEANGYVLSINGEEKLLSKDTTSFDISGYNYDISIKVKAVGGENTFDSDYSEVANKKVATIKISTAEQFENMVDGNSYSLENNITLDESYQPKTIKNGSLDGKNFLVTSVKPIFDVIKNYSIVNFNLKSQINVASNNFKEKTGALCNICENSRFSKLKINSTINAPSTGNGVGVVGGVSAIVRDSNFSFVQVNCEISATDNMAGGAFGIVESLSDNEEKMIFNDITASGNISATGSMYSYAGGVIALSKTNKLEVENCEAKNIFVTGQAISGGFVARMELGTIKKCKVKGTIKAVGGENMPFVHIGGFSGHVEGYNVRISDCFVDGVTEIENPSPSSKMGAFVGVTPGGTFGGDIYKNCAYSKSTNNIDRVGEGRGDGIEGK